MRTLLLIALTACTGGPDTRDPDPDSDTAAPSGCFGDPVDPDRDHLVVVSHPYGEGGTQATDYATLLLSPEGTLTPTGDRFSMGRAFLGPIRFSPDGRLGIAVQDDGTLGVFRVDGATVTVVQGSFGHGVIYAADVVFDTTNERVWIVDSGWREHGGGLYTAALDCDTGALSTPILAVASKQARAMIPRGDGSALVVAADIGDSATGDAHIVDLATGTVSSTASLWADDMAVYGGTALVDGTWLLVGNTAGWSDDPQGVAIARVDGDGVTATDTVLPMADPVAIAPSPWGNAALVASGLDSDRLYRLILDGGTWTHEVVGSSPLPAMIATVDAGPLRGTVLVADNDGVRHLTFAADGRVTDHGTTSLGVGPHTIVGTLGVQP